MFAGLDQVHGFLEWTPCRDPAGTPQNHSGKADGRRQMSDARVVTQESDARRESAGDLGQRMRPHHFTASGRDHLGQSFQPLPFRFPTHQQKAQLRLLRQPDQQFLPARFGPVLAITAGAWMDRQGPWAAEL